MVYHRVRGNGGQYQYFGCLSRQGRREGCIARHVQVDQIERAVERFYSSVHLTPGELRIVRKAVKDHAAALLSTAREESRRHAARLEELKNPQRKLLQLF